MTEWQKINTAPMDGTPVLIWDGEMMATATADGDYWVSHGATGYECENDFRKPTHWMPLPEPPK